MTEVVRRYDFNISRGVIAPDGYEKSVILVNGQFPGPLIEANWGEYIEVRVHNNIVDEPQAEGTVLHWHGFLQTKSPWEDGVPGVTQCPIAPGKSFTYKFRAELYGTSWYHSHYSAQYSGGLFGPIVVYGPSNVKYDVDLGPIMVNGKFKPLPARQGKIPHSHFLLLDWWHKDYFTVVEEVMAPDFQGRTFSDNNLINGRMNFNCSTVDAGDTTNCTNNAGLSKFKFQPGKTHRLRFINSGSEGVQRISIDGHKMTVVANDFVEIKPYDTTVVTVGIGQRVDVVVKADGDPRSAYWLRANMTSCSTAKQPLAMAAIYYDKADSSSTPKSTPWDVPDPGTCANDDLNTTEPLYPIALPEPSWTQNMDIGTFRNESGNLLWTFGVSTYSVSSWFFSFSFLLPSSLFPPSSIRRGKQARCDSPPSAKANPVIVTHKQGVAARVDYNDPTLLQIKNNDFQFDSDMNVMNFGTNSSIRFIVNNPTPS